MGAFLLLANPGRDEDRDSSVERQPSAHRLPLARTLTGPGFELRLYRKANGGGAVLYRRPDSDDFCAVSGTLIYRGQAGVSAARALLADFSGAGPPYAEACGSYAVIVRHSGELFLWTDRLGTFKVYVDTAAGAWSSSFLSLLDHSSRRRLDAQAVYEYAFQGASYGDATVVDGIRLARPNGLYRPLASGEFQAAADWWPDTPEHRDRQAAIRACLLPARQLARDLVSASGGGLDSALSGGYDSRLLLALLRAEGATPKLHVYGPADSPDVQVALAIGKRLDLAIQHTDKSRWSDPHKRPIEALVAENFELFDGLPTDGIFDQGADLATRLARCADGRLMLNGGGGEIYRNFFYLPDRRFRPREIIWSFYSKYVPAFCSPRFDAGRYTGILVEKLAATLGVDPQARLERRDVERVYPAFRLRYWTGRNNAINNRLGDACTPFTEAALIAEALRVPLAWKQAGRFEAQMIAAIDPELAACPSAYGHDFLQPPPWRRRLTDWLTRQRPPILRRYSHRLQARLRGPLPTNCLAGLPSSVWLPPKDSVTAAYFNLARINERGVLARVATLEYLCKRYRLEPD